MKRISVIVMLLLCGIAVSGVGCKRGEKAATAPAQKAATSATRYLNYHNWNEPEYLDPGMVSGKYESNIVRNVFEGLVAHNAKDASPEPAGAERWTVSADGLVYTFFLRKAAQWTDGKPVTAHDYVYSWERVLNPKTGSRYAFALYHFKNGQAYNTGKITDPQQLGFRAIDDYTLEVTLDHPAPYIIGFLCYPSFFPAPKWAIEKHGPKWTLPENIVSNGPFMVTKWVPHQEILAVKNPTYWNVASMTLAGVRYLPVEDKETALKMYEAGELDILSELPVPKIPSLKAHPDYVAAVWNNIDYLKVNVTKPPFNDVRVRQALSMAIDRDTLVNKYMQGISRPSTSYVPTGMKDYEPATGWGFDPVRAKALFAEAGYADPSKFPTFELLYNTAEENLLLATVLQQMWKQHLGITVQLHNEEWKSYMKTQAQLDYQVSRAGWVGDYSDPHTFLEMYTSDSTIGHTGWKNAEYDGLVTKSMHEQDPVQRFAIMRLAEAVLLREAPIIPTYVKTLHMLVKPTVKGFYGNLIDVHPMQAVTLDTAVAQGGGK